MQAKKAHRYAVIEVRGLPAQAVASLEVADQLRERGWDIVFVCAKIPAWLNRTYPELRDEVEIIKDKRIEKRGVLTSLLRIFLAFVRIAFQSSAPNRFTTMQICGIPVGDLIADSAIRRGGAQTPRWRFWVLFFRHALIAEQVLSNIRRIVKATNAELVVSSSQSYASLHGLLTRFGHTNQLEVINCAPTFIAFTKRDPEKIGYRTKAREDIHAFVQSAEISDELAKAVADFGTVRFSRESTNPDYRRIEIAQTTTLPGRASGGLAEALCEADDKRVLFIAPHVFSDAVHMDGPQIFRDYLDWFRHTIDAIQDAPSAVWITKEHPSAGDYGEHDLVSRVLARHDSKKRVRLLDPGTSPAAIVDASDAVVTVRGTVALEFGAHGKMALLAGSARYSHLGFTISPRNRREYFDALNSLALFPQLKCNPSTALAALYYFERHLIEENMPGSVFSTENRDLSNYDWEGIARSLEAARQGAGDPFIKKISGVLDSNPRRYVYE